MRFKELKSIVFSLDYLVILFRRIVLVDLDTSFKLVLKTNFKRVLMQVNIS